MTNRINLKQKIIDGHTKEDLEKYLLIQWNKEIFILENRTDKESKRYFKNQLKTTCKLLENLKKL